MEKLGPLMHEKDKVVFGNVLLKRLDLMSFLDGIFAEHGDQGSDMNPDAFLSVRKPDIEWVTAAYQFRPDPAPFLQRFMYMGTFPMAPYPGMIIR